MKIKQIVSSVSLLLIFIFTLSSCTPESEIYTIGICEFADNPSTADAERGFKDAFTEAGFVIDKDVKFMVSNAQGDFPTATLIVKNFLNSNVDMLCPLATPCLQACINSETDKPILFTRIANPFLAGAGKTVDDHLPNVTGVSTRSPFKQTVELIQQLIPDVEVLGTVWSPSELNSEYYLKMLQKAAKEAGLEVRSVPINSSSEMNVAVLSLVNKEIDCFYQISDNLTSLGLEAEIMVADEEQIPLFVNQTSDITRGAAVGVGWDFYDSGVEAGKLAVQVYQGADPAEIPILFMKKVNIYINRSAAARQGLQIPPEILSSAIKVID